MRICTLKATGKLIEMQSAATKGTLIQNALSAGYKEADIEEREITEAEWADPAAPWRRPTDSQLEAAAEVQRQAEFAWQDTKVWVLQQELRRGEITQEAADAALAPLDAFAKALRAMNNTEGWFRDPQWPTRP